MREALAAALAGGAPAAGAGAGPAVGGLVPFPHSWQGLVNRSMRIQDVYVGAVPIPRFIKKKKIYWREVSISVILTRVACVFWI